MSKAKVIAFANQKGGVGKTSCVQSIGIGLVRKEKKVLIIDVDAQANLSMGLGFEPDDLELTISELLDRLRNRETVENMDEYVLHSAEGIDLIASDMNLSGVEIAMQALSIDREFLLKTIVEHFENHYDFILLDCPPSLGILTLSALVAADEVIIPTQAQLYSVKGSALLVQNISSIQKRLNPGLRITGIIITMVNERTRTSQALIRDIKMIYGEHVHIFKTAIPQSVKASESTYEGKSIFLHDPHGKIAKAFSSCVEEILHGEV